MIIISHKLTVTLSCFGLLCVCLPSAVADKSPALLIVSYDGFRPEYFNRNVTPYMNRLRNEETAANYMQSVFPTKTFVNHFTIATGLYAGTHGVLANSVYDHKLNRNLNYSSDLFHYNPAIRPLWTLNELAGGHSGCMMWPGTDYVYSNRSCTFMQVYNISIPYKERVDMVIGWLTHAKTPANLVFLYVENPDHDAHIYSTDSPLVTDIVGRLDSLTKYIQDQLVAVNLSDRVNVVHVSDHGMTNVAMPRYIDLGKWLLNGTYQWFESSPVLQVIPMANANESDILRRLQNGARENGHFRVFTRENLPERWHLLNEQRMGPILVVADVNYGFQDRFKKAEGYLKKYNLSITPEREYGLHGYDNAEPIMRAIFFAKGPLIRRRNRINEMHNIDLYNIFCKILNLTPDANNGTVTAIGMVLIEDWRSYWMYYVMGGSAGLIGIFVGVAVYIVKRKNRQVYVV